MKVISNLQVQESKFGGNIYKFGGKSFKKLSFAEFMELVFSKSGPETSITGMGYFLANRAGNYIY